MEGSICKYGRFFLFWELNILIVLLVMMWVLLKFEFSCLRLEFGGRMGRDIVRYIEDVMVEVCDIMVCCWSYRV